MYIYIYAYIQFFYMYNMYIYIYTEWEVYTNVFQVEGTTFVDFKGLGSESLWEVRSKHKIIGNSLEIPDLVGG